MADKAVWLVMHSAEVSPVFIQVRPLKTALLETAMQKAATVEMAEMPGLIMVTHADTAVLPQYRDQVRAI